MSFSSSVKDELSRQMPGARHCQIAETAAILSLCGRVKISASDHFWIEIHTENVAVARKYFTLIKKTFNIESCKKESPGRAGLGILFTTCNKFAS